MTNVHLYFSLSCLATYLCTSWCALQDNVGEYGQFEFVDDFEYVSNGEFLASESSYRNGKQCSWYNHSDAITIRVYDELQ